MVRLLFFENSQLYFLYTRTYSTRFAYKFINLYYVGELLFKCGHCLYYHWLKRTAEAHVAEDHPGLKQFVRHVRREAIELKEAKKEKEEAAKRAKKTKEEEPRPVVLLYLPFKCGICDYAFEDESSVRAHLSEVHGIKSGRFLCSMSHKSFESKAEADMYSRECSLPNKGPVLRLFYVDQTSSSEGSQDERRQPLWSRDDQTRVKHIRGILFEEENADEPPKRKYKGSSGSSNNVNNSVETIHDAQPKVKEPPSKEEDVDNFPMNCKACDLPKKSIKALKTHIKLMHLRTGKFRYPITLCIRIVFYYDFY